MNKARRAEIERIKSALEGLDEAFVSLMDRLKEVLDEEQDAYNNMPEGFQNGEKGQKAQEAIDALTNAHNDLESFDISTITGYLDEAVA